MWVSGGSDRRRGRARRRYISRVSQTPPRRKTAAFAGTDGSRVTHGRRTPRRGQWRLHPKPPPTSLDNPQAPARSVAARRRVGRIGLGSAASPILPLARSLARSQLRRLHADECRRSSGALAWCPPDLHLVVRHSLNDSVQRREDAELGPALAFCVFLGFWVHSTLMGNDRHYCSNCELKRNVTTNYSLSPRASR